MKKFLFLCGLLMMGLTSWGQNESTTDHVSLSSKLLEPGGAESYVIFSLNGSRIYSAVGMDIIIPEGYTFSSKSNGDPKANMTNEKSQGLYAVSNPDEVEEDDATPEYNTHQVSCNFLSSNTLRITVWSSNSDDFNNQSGKMFRVYLKATPFAKPGVADIKIKNCFFVTSAGVKYVTDDITVSDKVSASTSATAPVTVSASNKWSTCILPFDAALPTGVKAYTCNAKNDSEKTLTLTEAASIEAYKPYILNCEDGYSGNLSGTVDANKYPANGYVEEGLLRGAIEPQEVEYGYVLQNLSEGVKFYDCAGNTFNIPAGKCWIKPLMGGAKGYSFDIEDATGINDIHYSKVAKNVEYNISGQRVSANYKGIVIINGKKILK